MAFQLWLRTLLNDAVVQNKAHIVAMLGPHDLRQLYVEGAAPSVDSIFKDYDGKATSTIETVIDWKKFERKIA